jgi:hypothetical protein
MHPVTWVLEPEVFLETHGQLCAAIRAQGHKQINWSDAWWSTGIPSPIPTTRIVFHGSLGNAARIALTLNWSPGSFCPVNAFHCSSWYESARQWLVHHDWRFVAANELVANAREIACQLGATDRIFVRPDSPLKPFSGRVVEVDGVSLSKLDHGFYYEDESLPVVAAPVQKIGKEWRFIIASRKVVAGSAYDPASRKPTAEALDSAASAFATEISSSIPSPADVYVLDVCECNGELRLLELNPFGGADLYASDPTSVVRVVSEVAATT